MLLQIGFLILCLGATMGDSESKLFPMILIAVGFVLVRIGGKEFEDEIEIDED